ncbi:MAG: hypothetical protein ABI870_02650 [Rhodanobacter sp.]
MLALHARQLARHSANHRVPELIDRHPDNRDFLAAIVSLADQLTTKAEPDDHSWLHGQIGNILARHGKLHEDLLPLSTRQSP